jgi:biotin carboxylase
MTNHIFLIGLNDFNLTKLKHIRGASAHVYHGVLDPAEVYDTEVFPIPEMLDRAERAIRDSGVPVDAIAGYMDFPVSTMLPILCAKFGTRTPGLESLLKCEHKYWSRVVQREVLPDHIPKFTAFDPFDDDALTRIGEAGLGFPFFVKPVKSSGSRLGFRIDSPEDFDNAITTLRAEINLIAEPFDYVLEHASLPPDVARVTGQYCMAEEIIGGHQCTVEGYVHDGDVVPYGIVDSIRYPKVLSFFHYLYPSGLPAHVQDRMRDLTKRLMTHTGFDNSAFNIEFFWDEPRDHIWLLEVNTRISQSHCDLFQKVDGVSHHQVTIDLALGRRPDMPNREGAYPVAAKFFHRVFFKDATVARVPTAQDIKAVEEAFPGTHVALQVTNGMRLSDLPEQDSYSYAVAYIWTGAHSHDALVKQYEEILARLPFEFTDIEE